MNRIVNIDGKLYAPEEARISVFDHGFLYGDSIYETMRTYDRKIFLLDRHLIRLQNSAGMLRLSLPLSAGELEAELYRTVDAVEGECYIRMIVTRGRGRIGLDTALCEKASYVLLVAPYEPLPEEWYKKGVKIALVDVRRNDRLSLNPGIKTCNLLNNVLAYMQTKDEQAYEGILCNLAGFIAEGTVSNVFIVRDGVLLTPPAEAGLLLGVTRGLTLELATKEGIPAVERNITPEEFVSSEECIITGTTKGLLPVSRIGARVLDPVPGPITARLLDAYDSFVAEYSVKRP